MKAIHDFLPISKEDLLDREWYYYDFLLITGDAYVDHPSFGTAIISRASAWRSWPSRTGRT